MQRGLLGVQIWGGSLIVITLCRVKDTAKAPKCGCAKSHQRIACRVRVYNIFTVQ
jgi:hypothetical protein